MQLSAFIKKRPHLIWYTENYENLSLESIVEAVLNYGNWDDFQELVKISGIKKIAAIFRNKLKQKRCNYDKKAKNYFQLYFNKYA